MHRGYVKFWRKAFDSGMHRNHKLWVAWTWILAHAAYRQQGVFCGGRRVQLRPGQLLAARARLAAEWNMSERSVRTVLAALAADGSLTVRATSRYSLLTVNNWELYQSREPGAPSPAAIPATGMGAVRRPAGGQPPTTIKEGEEGQKEDSFTTAPAARGEGEAYRTGRGRRLAGEALAAFESFWEAYGYRRGKAEAADAWLDLGRLDGEDLARVLAGARREAEARPALLARGRTPKMAAGWLAARRFEDEPDPLSTASGQPAPAPAAPRGPDPFLAGMAEARRRAVAMPERLRRLARSGAASDRPSPDRASPEGEAS